MAKEIVGSPKFPSYPFEHMPRSQTPVVSRALALTHTELLPSVTQRTSAFPPYRRRYPFVHNIQIFRGSITQPVLSLHPASDSPCGACLRVRY